MNILYVIHNIGADVPESKSNVISGGSERFTYSLAHKFSETNTCYILYTDVLKPSKLYLHRIEGLRNEFVREYEYNSKFCKLTCFSTLLEEYKIDLVNYQHLVHMPIEFPIVAKNKKIPQVLTLHDYFYICDEHFLENEKYVTCDVPADITECVTCLGSKLDASRDVVLTRREIMSVLVDLVDVVVAPSKCLRSDYFKIYPHINDKLKVIPIGIKPLPYQGVSNIDTLNIGIPNYITYIKGQIPMTNVIRICEKEVPDVKFHLLCDCLYEHQDKYYSQFPNVYKNAMGFKDVNLVWLPTIAKETFSIVVSENLFRGLPIMCLKKGALKERLSDDTTYFYEGVDTEEIVFLIKKINANKQDLIDKSNKIKELRDTIPTMDFTFLQYQDIYLNLTRKK